MSTRVVLADDHAVVRKGIRDFLEEDASIEVLADAGDGERAKELIQRHMPDVAVLDIRMPGATGIEITRWLREQNLPVHVLLLTAYDDEPFVVAALQAGANGYVLKNAEADEIIAAVHRVAQGQHAFGPEVTDRLFTHVIGETRTASLPEHLTEREIEVLSFAASGLTNRGIGVQLSISDRTVQGHLASIYGKLQVGSRTEAVTKALQLGLINLPENRA